MLRRFAIWILVPFVLLVACCIVNPLSAETWHVPEGCPTIHAGLDSAAYGDTVLVGPGTYQTTYERDTWVDLRDGVTLIGAGGPEATAIVICGDGGFGIEIANCEHASVSGFTVRWGTEDECEHDIIIIAGITCFNSTDVTVENCIVHGLPIGIEVAGTSTQWEKPVFRNNTIYDCSKGVYCLDMVDPGRPLFEDNTITHCGWGAWIRSSSPYFYCNDISYNSKDGMSYGYACGGDCSGNIITYNGWDGVSIYADPPLAVPDFNGGWTLGGANDIYGNGIYDLAYEHAPGSGGVIAYLNYWGGDCPDLATRVYGEVYTVPWTNAGHTRSLREEDCPGASESTTWGSIKALFR